MKNKFKDQCERCGNWSAECKGYDGKVLCPDCIKKEEQKKTS